MNKKLFLTINIKQNILTLIFSLFLIFLIFFSNSNMQAAKSGLILWSNHIIPSLFPFFIATELLNYTNISYYLGKLTKKIMRPLFNVPSQASYAFIIGLFIGYPIGAKIISNFVENNICTKEEAARMLAFTNNSSPLFIIGTVGISLFGDKKIGIILFITHILACITVGILFGFLSKRKHIENCKISYNTSINNSNNSNNNFTINSNNESPNLGILLGNSITTAVSSTLLVGGFIVLFSIIISMFNNLKIINFFCDFFALLHIPSQYTYSIFTGILELTNGINAIVNISSRQLSYQIILSAFILGFAGLSVLLQVFSVSAKQNISMKPYIIGKFLHGIFAALYTYIILYAFNFFYFDILAF